MSAPVSIFNRLSRAVSRAVSAASVRWQIASYNLWRDQHNPLRGLTISVAARLLEEGERGAYAELQWLYRHIEMQDATLGSLVERRTSAIQELDWDIKVREDLPEEKKAIAERQEAALKSAYERIGNLTAAIEFFALASFRGFAHAEKVRDSAGRIVELEPVEQWFWVRDGLYGDWQLNPRSISGSVRGDDVDLSAFVVREVARPINRVALVNFVRKGLSQKDWDAFIEQFGIPAIFVSLSEGTPADKMEEYLAAAEAVTSAASGALPPGAKIDAVDGSSHGGAPFAEHLKYQDEQMVLRGTGGKLTMLAESGSGTLAGSAHQEAFDAIARAEAAEISEIFRQQIDAEILAETTPGEQAWAYFEIAANEETDTSAIVEDVEALSRAGYQVDPAWISEKTGYEVTFSTAETPETAKTPPQIAANRLEGGEPDSGAGLSPTPQKPAQREIQDPLTNRDSAKSRPSDSPEGGSDPEGGGDPVRASATAAFRAALGASIESGAEPDPEPLAEAIQRSTALALSAALEEDGATPDDDDDQPSEA